MQVENRFLDDLARVANGAIGTLTGLREEIEALVKQRVERFLADMDLVTRDEFEAVKAVAAKARAEQEALEIRIAALEAGPAKQARKPAAKKKPAGAKAAPGSSK